MTLAGKNALITGGGTGIGEAIALAFAKEGCRVAICGRRADKLQQVADQFAGEPKILQQTVDVGVRDSVVRLFEWAAQQLGHVDILVNSAGINVPDRAMSSLSPDDWDRLLQINATGTYNCMWAVLPQMRQRQDGVIINISSIAGVRASPLGGVAYNAAKFAQSALGHTVAIEEKDHGIRVSTIYPGEVETPILDDRPVPVSAEHRAKILQPQDVAAAALMIACLPPRANVVELIIKPTTYPFV